MANKFEDEYKEWKIEGKREKTLDANYMGSESLSRLRYQSSQSRGRSRDKQGRPWNDERGWSRSYGTQNNGGGIINPAQNGPGDQRQYSQSGRSGGQGDQRQYSRG